MAVTDQATALIGVFGDRRHAEHFVDELKRAGFRDDQMGVIRRNEVPADDAVEDTAVAGALTGGALGALTGVILTAGLIPGIGPVVLGGGLLAGILGGAAAGATAGGVLGALVGLGIPEEEARHYESDLKAGRTLVVVQGGSRLPQALDILRRVEASEPATVPPAPTEKPHVEQLDELL
jgi:hypothetical protein